MILVSNPLFWLNSSSTVHNYYFNIRSGILILIDYISNKKTQCCKTNYIKHTYIYIYIYICVCVYVCVFIVTIITLGINPHDNFAMQAFSYITKVKSHTLLTPGSRSITVFLECVRHVGQFSEASFPLYVQRVTQSRQNMCPLMQRIGCFKIKWLRKWISIVKETNGRNFYIK